MGLKFFNTLTRNKEDFAPLDKESVKLYTCGPTVYNFIHIGNLRTFLFEDILVRYLTFKGYKVKQVMNITDVDDKTIRNSKKEGVSLSKYTQKYTKAFFNDIKTLNIIPAWKYPKATEHIEEMIELVSTLLEKGIAYKSEGSVYFSISKFQDYGKLSHLDKSKLLAGKSGRVDSDEYEKDFVGDFVLWKAYTDEDGDVFWETDFGKGRPGWHLECSAMSMKYLGQTFDIHTGGIDNIFPHHENEIAQSEACTNKNFVNYWMHSEHLHMGEKMSKSLGNIVNLKTLIDKGYSPQSIRYALISSHYRMPLDYSEELLKQAQGSVERFNDFVFRLSRIPDSKRAGNDEIKSLIDETMQKFSQNMDDDLNISPAIAAVFDFIRKVNSIFDSLNFANANDIIEFMKKIDGVIGVISFQEELDPDLIEEVECLINDRQEAKKMKDFATADAIRDQLNEMGIEIRDTKDGVMWNKK